MASYGTIAKEVLKALLAMGMGGAGRAMGGGISGAVLNGITGGKISPQAAGFTAASYPDSFAPDRYHHYTVHNIPGAPNFNAEGKTFADVIEEAGVMQDIDEHNAAIMQYVRPGMSPREEREAIRRGVEEEKKLPKFWNESNNRREFSVSSSAVSGIRLTPDARIEVEWKGNPGTWYTFRSYPDTHEASKAAQELLKADSLGRAVMPWQRNGIPLKFKDPDVSWWNRKNYDPTYAG